MKIELESFAIDFMKIYAERKLRNFQEHESLPTVNILIAMYAQYYTKSLDSCTQGSFLFNLHPSRNKLGVVRTRTFIRLLFHKFTG